MEFITPNLSETELYIPHQIWGHDLSNQIKNIHVTNGVFVEKGNKIIHEPNKKIIVRYDVLNTKANFGASYYTYINRQGFYLLYGFALIYPKIYRDDEKVNVDFRFASNNNVFTSFGNVTSNKTQKLRLTVSDLISHGFAISGSRNILQKANLADTNIIFFDIDKQIQQDLSVLLNKIIKAQNRFFEATNNNHLFVFINNQCNHHSYYGTLIGDKTTLYLLPKKFNVNDFRVKHLLGHENLHKWIGSNLVKKKEELRYKWFTEGFTRYFTDKINLNNGIITFGEYLYNYNNILCKYYTSPYLAIDNDNLSKLYWKDSQAHELPYNRGYIIAQELDLKIQKTTRLRSSLDNIIKIIVKNHLLNVNPKFTTEDMVKYTNYITENNFKYIIDKFVKYGNFDLNSNFPNSTKLCFKKIEINEYGFNIATPQKIVRNLKINTEAYKAGLRNDDKFKYVSASQKGPESMVEIIIELTNGKLIKYKPKKKSVIIPEYGVKCTNPF